MGLNFARLAGLGMCLVSVLVSAAALAGTAAAQPAAGTPPWPPDCHISVEPVAGSRPLPAVREALAAGRLRVLAIGSSSTSGIGASVAAARYPARLQARLRKAFGSSEIVVANRGIPGETALGAAARMKREVKAARPDLVIWQLGTNAALNNIEIAVLIRAVRRAVAWLRSENIGLMFIDPQFVDIYKDHAHYKKMVEALTALARTERIVLVRRYATMADFAAHGRLGGYLARDQFHLNDLGYRCMASFAAHAIVNASKPD